MMFSPQRTWTARPQSHPKMLAPQGCHCISLWTLYYIVFHAKFRVASFGTLDDKISVFSWLISWLDRSSTCEYNAKYSSTQGGAALDAYGMLWDQGWHSVILMKRCRNLYTWGLIWPLSWTRLCPANVKRDTSLCGVTIMWAERVFFISGSVIGKEASPSCADGSTRFLYPRSRRWSVRLVLGFIWICDFCTIFCIS